MAPLILLETAGYRYSIKKHAVEKTGIIYVSSLPPNATVTIDGETQKDLTPHSFDRLADDYSVRISKDGYLPWQKTLPVASGQTTFIKDVHLVKDALPKLESAANAIDSAVSNDGKSAALLTNDGNEDEIVFVKASGAATTVTRFPASTYTGIQLSLSPLGDFILMTAHESHKLQSSPDRIVVLLFSVASHGVRAFHDEITADIVAAHWSVDGGTLVVVAGGASPSVYLIDPHVTEPLMPAYSSSTLADATVASGTLFVLETTRDGVALSSAVAGTAKLVKTMAPGHYRFLESSPLTLMLTDGTTAMLIDQATGAVLASADGDSASEPTDTGAQLVWNSHEVSRISAKDGDQLITRLSETINGCGWDLSGTHAICATPTDIRSLEIDDRDTRNVFTLLRYTAYAGFGIDRENSVLLFAGTVNGQQGLFSREF